MIHRLVSVSAKILTMKAIVIHNFGKPNNFQVIDLPKPKPLSNQVLIEVKATSVNPVDTKIRQGVLVDLAPDFPAVLHGDVAGTITEVGRDVDTFQVGDEVYGCAGGIKGMDGALAEYMIADADLIARKPKSITMTQAAALPLISITAWEGLIDRAKIQSQQKVLIYGGTGGVGHLAIQLAKNAGAKVYATVSNQEKREIAVNLGADVAIDYRNLSVAEFVEQHTSGRGFDLVFDTVGDDNLQNAFQAAKLNGTIASTVALSKQDLTLVHAKGLSLHLVYMLLPMLSGINRVRHGNILTELANLVDLGKIRPLVDNNIFSFTEVGLAHAYLESGKAIGKIVLTNDLLK